MPYGNTCPFCQSEVPSAATVCASCNAYKGTRADLGGLWGRLLVWAHTIGLVIVLSIVGAVSFWNDGKWYFSIAWSIAALLVLKALIWVWKKIFGTLSDPRWIRRH